MGNLLSNDDPQDPTPQQQQRAQLLLLSRLRAEQLNGGVEAAAEGGLLGLRPTQQPSFSQSQVFKNPLHVHSRTVRVEQKPADADGQGGLELAFTFDALVPAEAVVFVGAWDDSVGRPAEGSAWTSSPVAFPTPQLGLECRLPLDLSECPPRQSPGMWGVSFGQLDSDVLCFCIELRGIAPDLAAKEDVAQDTVQDTAQPTAAGAAEGAFAFDLPAEWTKGRLLSQAAREIEAGKDVDANPSVVAEVQSQSVYLPEAGTPLIEREIFGGESRGGPAVLGQDCVICMSERRDTAVLPCRHMCLCGGCAETMRSRVQYRSYRCPMCRERVSSMLQVHRPDAAIEAGGT